MQTNFTSRAVHVQDSLSNNERQTYSNKTAVTCDTVVLALVEQDPVGLPQLSGLDLVVEDGIHQSLVKQELCLPKPHVVNVHVGGADSELADVFVQWISFKPHGTEERYLGKLIVENVLSIDDPDACRYFLADATDFLSIIVNPPSVLTYLLIC